MLDESDAGRGILRRGRWLVSAPAGRRLRWLAPWLQALLCDCWNVVAAHPRYFAMAAAAFGWFEMVVHLDPLLMPLLGAVSGTVLGLIWIAGPMMGPRRSEL